MSGHDVRRRCFALVLLGVLAARSASAEPETPPPQPALVPPKLVASESPEYPPDAEGSADVLLEVVVEADGSVGDVIVLEGREGFADAAVRVVKSYRFEPARRADTPVRARIRISVTFSPPEARTRAPATAPPPRSAAEGESSADRSSSVPDASSATDASDDPALREITEVQVTGARAPRSPTEHRLGRAEVRVIPGAFGDPFRAIDILPGVVPVISGLPYYYIRGAPPSAVGYYVDEVRVPYLFHFGLGPGVIQPALIEEVSLHPSAYPARYGRHAGGIVAGRTRDPSDGLRGEAQLRFFDAGAYVEAPFADGRATVGVGGRYSYTAALISLFAPDITIDYRDYNARASYQLSDRWRASVLTFGAFDYASDTKRGIERVLFASEFHRVDLRLDHRGDDGSVSRIATTLGLDRTRLEGARFAQNWLTGLRGRHTWPVGAKAELEVGADLLAENYAGDLPSPYAVEQREYEQARTLFSPRLDTSTGAWFSAIYRPFTGWELTAIARADLFTSAGKLAIGPSPRISARIPLTTKLAFLSTLGVAPQPPAFSIPVPAVGYSGLPGGLSFAYQKSAGLELALPLEFNLRGVGFHHSYFNLRDISPSRDEIDIDTPQLSSNSPSQAYGLEAFLGRKLSTRYSAFTSLTLMRSEIGASRLLPARVAPFDRTYVWQLGGVADLGKGWRASARFLTYAGWPQAISDQITGATGRLPSFRRIDVRIEKRWTLRSKAWISLVLEVLNATAAKEVVASRCIDSSDSSSNCENDAFGPVVAPSLGLEAGL